MMVWASAAVQLFLSRWSSPSEVLLEITLSGLCHSASFPFSCIFHGALKLRELFHKYYWVYIQPTSTLQRPLRLREPVRCGFRGPLSGISSLSTALCAEREADHTSSIWRSSACRLRRWHLQSRCIAFLFQGGCKVKKFLPLLYLTHSLCVLFSLYGRFTKRGSAGSACC